MSLVKHRLLSARRVAWLVSLAPLLAACSSSSAGAPAETEPTATAAQDATAPRIIAYAPTYQDPTTVPWSKLTHVIATFIAVDPNAYTCVPDTSVQNLVNYRNSNYPNVKILLSVGGALGSAPFPTAMSAAYRSAFVSSCSQLVAGSTGADGLDIDWENPQNATDAANLTATLDALRQSPAYTGQSGKLLTAAIQADNATYEYWNFFTGSPRRFDWVNVMTYDFNGPWTANTVGANAPYANATSAMAYASTQVGAANNASLVMGLPYYSYGWSVSPSCTTPGCPGTTFGYGYLTAGQMQSLAASSPCQVTSPTPGDKYVYCPGTVSVGGNSLTNAWFGYEDTGTVTAKASFVKANGYGGLMYWREGYDTASHDLTNAVYSALTVPTPPPSPQAVVVNGSYAFHTEINPSSCMDVSANASADGTQIQEYACSGGTSQTFTLLDAGGGLVTLMHPHSGKCVDLQASGTANGTKVQLWDCSRGVSQQFAVSTDASGNVTFTNPHSGRCLDVKASGTANGTLVQLYDCNGGKTQKWAPAPGGLTTGATYAFETQVNPSSCLDDSSNSATDGTQIQEWACNGGAAQGFAVAPTGDGSVNLKHVSSGKCVDVQWSGTADGTKIQLWDCNGTGAQSFLITSDASGNVTFTNPESNRCLDVTWSGTANGTPVQLWDCNGGSAQRWTPTANVAVSGKLQLWILPDYDNAKKTSWPNGAAAAFVSNTGVTPYGISNYPGIYQGKAFDQSQVQGVVDAAVASGIGHVSLSLAPGWYDTDESAGLPGLQSAVAYGVGKGVTMHVRFGYEMNGSWSPAYNGGDPTAFKAMWAQIAVKVHAAGGKMVWAPNVDLGGGLSGYQKWLPSDTSTIDFIGLDKYHQNASAGSETLMTNSTELDTAIGSIYPLVQQLGKPFILTETGVRYYDTTGWWPVANPGEMSEKQTWLNMVVAPTLRAKYPAFIGFAWFDYNKQENVNDGSSQYCDFSISQQPLEASMFSAWVAANASVLQLQ